MEIDSRMDAFLASIFGYSIDGVLSILYRTYNALIISLMLSDRSSM